MLQPSVQQPISRRAEVPPELAGARVDRAAAELFGEFSRAALSRWIAAGALTVDGAAVKPKARLKGGETLRLEADAPAVADWQTPQTVPFAIVHEDEWLLVVDKPPGVVVHPGAGNRDHTLVNGLLARRPALAGVPRAGIVHRLDKDTSGLLLVAASRAAHKTLVAALQARAISRSYLAVVEGVLVGGRTIDAPIGRDPVRRTRQRVRGDGRRAVTRVRVLERYRAHTLIEAALETGRTHQIRVHLGSVGHPLVGDRRYGARGRLPRVPDEALVAGVRGFRRQALHAGRLGLAHPGTGAPVEFEAPPPADFAALVSVLRGDRERGDA